MAEGFRCRAVAVGLASPAFPVSARLSEEMHFEHRPPLGSCPQPRLGPVERAGFGVHSRSPRSGGQSPRTVMKGSGRFPRWLHRSLRLA